MIDNLKIYNAVRDVPNEAKKEIKAGRIKGFTDINPMWRIKTLTETFGICGIGWKYVIKRLWIEEGTPEVKTANVEIDLFIKHDGQWSDAIPGIGGSMLSALEKSGLYISDECYKMALTDAISVACKALGFGADVYWQKDASKYDNPQEVLTPEQIFEAEKIEVMNFAMENPDWKIELLTYFNVGSLDDMKVEEIKSAYKSVIKKRSK